MPSFLSGHPTVSRLVFACYVRPGMGDALHRRRPSHGLAFNCGGEKRYCFSDGRIFKVGKNEIIYLPKGSSYEVSTDALGEVYAINFDLDTDGEFSPMVFRPHAPSPLLAAFREAENAFRTRPPDDRYLCFAALYTILGRLEDEAELPYVSPAQADRLRPALDLAARSYTDPSLTVSALAAAAGVSEVYLRKLFRLVTGGSPAAYLLRLRLERARELVGSGICTVANAAALSGFSDPTVFSRAHRRIYGKSPRALLSAPQAAPGGSGAGDT